MDKRQRNYVLEVETIQGTTLIIRPPFSIEFDVDRNDLSSTNVGLIRIYNLSEQHRKSLAKNQYDGDALRRVKLSAGYGANAKNLPVILNGNIVIARSWREGVNFITELSCFDAGYAAQNAHSAKEYPEGTAIKSIITDLLGDLKKFNVTVGAIGDFPGVTTRASVYNGSTYQLLRELTGGQFFIDNNVAHCLKDNESIQFQTLEITSDSGLLGTPIREELFFRFDMIFEPKLFLFQQILLHSSTGQNFNGVCKIVGLQHKGMISETVGGSVISSVKLSGAQSFIQVPRST